MRRAAPLRRARRAALTAAIALGLTPGALAQTVERPGDERPELPRFEGPPAPERMRPSVLPEIPETTPSGPPVFVREVRIRGSSVLSEAESAELVAPFEGRLLTPDELIALRRRVTGAYIARGYATSGAELGAGALRDGVLHLRAVEGALERVEIEGAEALAPRYLEERIELAAAPPLDVGRLQGALQRLQRDPRIDRLRAHLGPGSRSGLAILRLQVEETDPVRGAVRVTNHQPPALGGFAGELRLTHRSVTRVADSWDTRLLLGEGIRRVRSRYERPVSARDTTLGAEVSFSTSDVVNVPDDLAIDALAWSVALSAAHPIWRGDRLELRVGLEAALRQSRTSVFDVGTEIGEGEENGRARVAVLRASQQLTYRTRHQVWAARSQLSAGFDVLGATLGRSFEPDGQFVAWLAQLQWARRWPWRDVRTLLRGDLQLASDPLLSLERVAVGGARSVRGYRENALVRDQAAVASLELRVPVWRRPHSDWRASVGPFADYGYAWNRARATPGPRALAGVGAGLRLDWRERLRARLAWGWALLDVELVGEHDVQDDGLHVALEWLAF